MANTTTKKPPRKPVAETKPAVQEVEVPTEVQEEKSPLVEESPREEEKAPEIQESPLEEEIKPLEEKKPVKRESIYSIVPLSGGKHELRMKTQKGFKVLTKGTFEKCLNYKNQIEAR